MKPKNGPAVRHTAFLATRQPARRLVLLLLLLQNVLLLRTKGYLYGTQNFSGLLGCRLHRGWVCSTNQ